MEERKFVLNLYFKRKITIIKNNNMSKRSKVNIIIFSVVLVAAVCLMLFYFLVGYSVLDNLLGVVFAVVFSLFFTMTVNAWIFNWAAKKFFDKFFSK